MGITKERDRRYKYYRLLYLSARHPKQPKEQQSAARVIISQALLEVKRYLSLPLNTLVNTLPNDNIPSLPMKKNALSVLLNPNFMARVPDKPIRQSIMKHKRVL